jgi:hypothetical protein
MAQGGKSAGKTGGGKTSQAGKPGGKSGTKPGGKTGTKPGGKTGDNNKKASNKTNSMSILSSSCCLCIVYSIVIAILGSQAIKTVGENPQLLAMV